MSNVSRARARRLAAVFWIAGILATAGSREANAHDARPLSIGIFEQAGDTYRVRLQVPESVESINQPRVEWPDGCESRNEPTRRSNYPGSSGIVTCDAPLAGQIIRFKYALFNPSLSTVARFTPFDGPARVEVLGPDRSEWRVPAAPRRFDVAVDYLALGIGHILGGIDHLLFVLGLLLIARTPRRIFVVITGFTAAHSVTLSLSALGFLDLPILPAEAVIALSILVLACEIIRGKADSLAVRYPILVSASFGLLHGLGFAAALARIGLPQGEIVTSLLFFNVGVEAGQILFILPILASVWALARVVWRYPSLQAAIPTLRLAAAYGIGVPASFWLIERIAQF